MDPEISKVLLRIEDAAKIAKVHPTALIKYERQGRIPPRRAMGKSKVYLRSEFEAWLGSHENGRAAARASVPRVVGIRH